MQMSSQKRATVVSTTVALFLLIIKLFIGVASGSVAVLASAIDSLLDMGISIFNFFAIKKSEEKPDDFYQYGKGKVQAIAGVIEGTVITLSGAFIIYEAIKKMLYHKTTALLFPSIVAMLISIVATYFLVKYLLKIASQTDSIVIKADALHYKTDLWSNGAVLVSLVLVYLSGWDMIDAIFGLGIGVYIIYSAYEIIVEGIETLLDKALDKEILDSIDSIITSHKEVTSYHWLKTRSDGVFNFVEFHLVLQPNMILLEAHRIAEEIEDEIMKLDDNRKWVITPHFDPYDDEDMNNALLHGKTLMEMDNKNV
jgi:cation diffusion facilitator family transporter